MPNSHGSDGERAVEQRSEEAVAAAEPEAGPTVAELEARNADLENRYKRALADLDNYRKRAGREIERRVGEERERVAREWLTPSTASSGRCEWESRRTLSSRDYAPCSSRWRRFWIVRASARGRAGRPVRSGPARGGGRALRRRRARPHHPRRRALRLPARRPRASPRAGGGVAARRSARADVRRLPRLLRGAGRAARRERGGHPPRLPQLARENHPDVNKAPGRGGPLQGDLRGVRGAPGCGEAQQYDRSARTGGRPGGRGPGRVWRLRQAAAASAMCASSTGAARTTSATSSSASSAAARQAGRGGAAASTVTSGATRRR